MAKSVFIIALICEVLFGYSSAGISGAAGITESYRALPPSGGVVRLDHDLTITSPQILSMSVGKPLFLDLNGHTIICMNTAGTCLTVFKPDARPRYPLTVYQGRIIYRGSSPGVVGLTLGSDKNPISNISVRDLEIDGFNTPGSIGLSLVNAQDGHYEAISFGRNSTGLSLGLSTIQNQFSNLWFQENTVAIHSVDAAEASFIDCLIQSSNGTRPVEIISKTTNITNINFQHCHFEDNGDGTENTRQIVLKAEAGRYILNTEFIGNTFNQGHRAAKSTVFEFSGPGIIYATSFASNQYNIPNLQTGAARTKLSGVNDKMQQFDTYVRH